MWFGISFPLVFIGFYFGFRKQPYEHPVRTNQIPRQIPDQVWYLTPVARSVCVCVCAWVVSEGAEIWNLSIEDHWNPAGCLV